MTSYCIIIRCQDLPEVRYEIHQFELTDDKLRVKETKARYQETERTVTEVISELHHQGFTQLATPVYELDESLLAIVTKACPFEFRMGLWECDPAVTDRISLWIKESQRAVSAIG